MDTSLFPCFFFALENLRHLCIVGVIDLFCQSRQKIFHFCLLSQVSYSHVLGQAKIHAEFDKVTYVHLPVFIAKTFVKAVETRNVAELYCSGNCEVTKLLAECHKDVLTAGYSGFVPHLIHFLAFLLLILPYQSANVTVSKQCPENLFCKGHRSLQMHYSNCIVPGVNLKTYNGVLRIGCSPCCRAFYPYLFPDKSPTWFSILSRMTHCVPVVILIYSYSPFFHDVI